MEDKSTTDNIKVLKRVIKLAGAHKFLLGFSIFLAVVLAPVSILSPYLIKVMVDDYILDYDLLGLRNMALITFGVLIIEASMRYAFIYSSNLLGQNVIQDLRNKIFNHIMRLNMRYFDITPIGTSTTRTVNDVEAINSIFSQGLMTIIADVLGVFAVLFVMFLTSWKLTVACLVLLPFMVLTSYIFKVKVKAAYEKVRSRISEVNAFLQERITGMRVVKILSAEKRQKDAFKELNKAYTQANLDNVMYYSVFFPVVELISALSLALVIWWGARGILDATITIGALIAFTRYLQMFFRPIRMLADKFNTLQMGLVAAQRAFSVMDKTDFIEDNGALTAENIQGDISFENVEFSYDDEHQILKNVSFEVEAGQTLAIVGTTGSGKSTIINLLMRFYDIPSGKITIDNQKIEAYKLGSLRQKMAMVLQDVFLFSGSILDNITMRDKEITRDEVIASAKMIGAHDHIMQLPNGYDTPVLERGAMLSMGQRQLVSFVRALVVNPQILILDEATSSVDPESEQVIQFAIEKLIAKRTSIIIAHRLETIKNADRILVMDDGQIIENGTLDELLTFGGKFKELYDMQYGKKAS